MVFLRFFLPLAFLATTNCARPNYATNENATGLSGKPSGSICSATLPSSLCVKVTWETWPTESTFGSFVFLISDLKTNVLAVAPPQSVSVALWMPSMGHGSSPVTVEQVAPGIFRAKKVFFNMKGDWEIRFLVDGEQGSHALQF